MPSVKALRTLMRVASFTRRYDRHGSPVGYFLARTLVKLLYPKRHRGPQVSLVVDSAHGLMNVSTGSLIESAILFRGVWEPGITGVLSGFLKPGDACLDIGANVGAHTLTMARAVGPKGRVIALEPHPVICGKLLRNIALNGLRNVVVVQAALWNEDGSRTLHVADETAYNQGRSSLLSAEGLRGETRVRTMTGRTLVRELGIGSCNLIKIDTEGADFIALSQLADVIAGHRPCVIFEHRQAHWAEFGYAFADAVQLLQGLKYDMYWEKHGILAPLEEQSLPAGNVVCVPGMPTWACSAG
jgi:FkbM family methyltransferase